MANEILLAAVSTPTDVISDAISRALVEKVVCIPFVFAENLPSGTLVKKARKDGALDGTATVTEGSNYTYVAGSAFAQTSVSLTIGKSVIASKITIEAEQFGGVNDATVIAKQGQNLARTLDAAVKALASGFSQTVTATSTLTIEDLMQAAYLIRAGNAAADGQKAKAFVDYKGRHELNLQVVQSGAQAFSVESQLSLLSNISSANGYAGSIPGVDVFETGGLPTGGGKRSAMVINPELALFGMYGTVQVFRTGPTSQGVFTEILSLVFSQVAEWNDLAGVQVKSTQ